jgi:hypothetical protein
MSLLSSELKSKPKIITARSSACCLLHAGFLLILTLKVEVICSSQISVEFHLTMLHYVPEDRNLVDSSISRKIPVYALYVRLFIIFICSE